MQYVVPSYRRPEGCAKRTLSFLRRQGVPASSVKVYLSDWGEVDAYRAMAGSYCPEFCRGAANLPENRNRIVLDHAVGERLMWLDDDVDDVLCLDEERLVTVPDFAGLVHEAFDLAKKFRVGLWGVSAVANAFYMAPGHKLGLFYCVGAFYGTLNSHDDAALDGNPERGPKEDYHRSIRYFLRDGAVLRLSNVSIKTTFMEGFGGLNWSGRKERHRLACEWMVRRYPHLCSSYVRKSTDWTELRLRNPKDRSSASS